jgi:hypothetical protein
VVEECPSQLPFSEVAELLNSLSILPESNEVRHLSAALRSKVQESSYPPPPPARAEEVSSDYYPPVRHPPDGRVETLQSGIMHSWDDIAHMQQRREPSGWIQ